MNEETNKPINITCDLTFGPEAFERTLVLCLSKDGLSRAGEMSLKNLASAGATVMRSDGISNVTQHRNYLAADAMDFLERTLPVIEKPYWFILFLDSDMMVRPPDVLKLMNYMSVLMPPIRHRRLRDGNWHDYIVSADGRERDLHDDPLLWAPIVSALYVGRRARSLAAHRLRDAALRYVPRQLLPEEVSPVAPPAETVVAVPATCGLGCALMSVPAFWAHMCASPRSESTEHKDGLPVAFQSGVIPHSGTFLTEDIWFTYRSWLLGRGCYVIPDVCVGHVMPVAVFPEEDAAQVLIDESEAQSPAEPTPKESNLPPSPEAAPPETAPE